MHTLYLDGRDYATPRALHMALQRMLALPAYYGMNADALYDCLSERDEAPTLWIAHPGESDVAKALRAVCAAVEDLDGCVRLLGSGSQA